MTDSSGSVRVIIFPMNILWRSDGSSETAS